MPQKLAKIVLIPFALLIVLFPLTTLAQTPIFGVGDICGGAADPKCPDGYTCDTAQGHCILSDTPEKIGVNGINSALAGTSVVATDNVRDLVVKYVNFALPLLALAAFAGFVYAGFLYVLSFGNEEGTGKAKKVMLYAVIGLVLVILSYSIVQLFTVNLANGVK
jgi:hypothetical protein